MNRWFRVAAFLGGALVLGLLVADSGPGVIVANLRRAGWAIGPLVLLWSVVYACNARAWQLLVPDRPATFTFPRAYLLSITGFGINYATPWLSVGGEPFKVMGATPLLGRNRAVGSVVGFRFLHSLSHLLVFILAIVPAAILLPHTPVMFALLGATAIVLTVLSVFLLSQHRDGIFERGVALLRRLGPLRRFGERLERHRETLQALDSELTAVHRAGGGHFAGALAIEMSGRVLSTLEYVIIMHALGVAGGIWQAFVVANITSIITNIFFFVPFEMGAKEGSNYGVFGLLGFDPALGTSAALLSRLREMTWMLIGLGCLLATRPDPSVSPGA